MRFNWKVITKVIALLSVVVFLSFSPPLLFLFLILFCCFIGYNMLDGWFLKVYIERVVIIGKIYHPPNLFNWRQCFLFQVTSGDKKFLALTREDTFKALEKGDFITVRYFIGGFSKYPNGGVVI